MSVRLPSDEEYKLQVEKEQRWLPVLAPLLPLAIPEPLALGNPSNDYPWHWSVNRWIDGEDATIDRIDDLAEFAIAVARFLVALQRIDSSGGPQPGPHNFFRGGSPAHYESETLNAVAALDGLIDSRGVMAVWEAAKSATWLGLPQWLHGDVFATNLLVRDGRLRAVIDFGICGVGDPACDLTIAWTFFTGESRAAFRDAIGLDNANWARARGWAMWKALISLVDHLKDDPVKAAIDRRVIDEVVEEHRSTV
jgi:aminoglycoside phosphotransferase (APT) family kinase protein